jgi:hypothetical protein
MAKKEKIKKPFNLQTKLTAALRKVWRYSPARSEALERAKDPSRSNYLICERCNKSIHEKLCQVDHMESVVPVEGFTTWDIYIERMFCPSGLLRVLCAEVCHKQVTAEQRQAKSEYKKSLKPVKIKKSKNAKA